MLRKTILLLLSGILLSICSFNALATKADISENNFNIYTSLDDITVTIEGDSSPWNMSAEDTIVSGNFAVGDELADPALILDIPRPSSYGAPAIWTETQLKINTNGTYSLRFLAEVTPSQRTYAEEYGFIISTAQYLDLSDKELRFDSGCELLVSGISYKVGEIDIINSITEDGNYIVSAALGPITLDKSIQDFCVRPYIIYNGSEEGRVTVYGDIYASSLFKTARLINNSNADPTGTAESIVNYVYENLDFDSASYADMTGVYFQNADGLININLDSSEYYTISLDADDIADFVILDADRNELEIKTIPGSDICYCYLERYTDYYIFTFSNYISDYIISIDTIRDIEIGVPSVGFTNGIVTKYDIYRIVPECDGIHYITAICPKGLTATLYDSDFSNIIAESSNGDNYITFKLTTELEFYDEYYLVVTSKNGENFSRLHTYLLFIEEPLELVEISI